jgi:hypothetical protein
MNEKTEKTTFHLFWSWNDEKEERWLSRLAKEGWHLAGIRAVLLYRFIKGEPAEMVYRLDYTGSEKIDRKEYLGIFKDAGWEQAAESTGWHYFRTRAEAGAAPEIFTDKSSRIARDRRILRLLSFFFIFGLWNFGNLLRSRARYGWLWDLAVALQLTAEILLGYGILRLLINIKRIRKGRSAQP